MLFVETCSEETGSTYTNDSMWEYICLTLKLYSSLSRSHSHPHSPPYCITQTTLLQYLLFRLLFWTLSKFLHVLFNDLVIVGVLYKALCLFCFTEQFSYLKTNFPMNSLINEYIVINVEVGTELFQHTWKQPETVVLQACFNSSVITSTLMNIPEIRSGVFAS